MLSGENNNFNSSGHFSFIGYFIMNGLYSVNLQWKKTNIRMSDLKIGKL